MKSILLTVVMLAGLISTGFVLYPGTGSQPAPAGSDSELIDKNSIKINLEQYKGKVVFINNWASWCPPCIAEMPSIQTLKNNLKNEDIVFLMVSYDESQDKALNFIKKKNFDFDVYFPGTKYPFHTKSIPATFILDKNGVVVASHSGMANFDNPELVKKIKDLIK